jgi:hypothetical protein
VIQSEDLRSFSMTTDELKERVRYLEQGLTQLLEEFKEQPVAGLQRFGCLMMVPRSMSSWSRYVSNPLGGG